MKTYFTICFLLIFAATSLAQNSFTIKGQFIDEEKESIPYVTLSIAKDAASNVVKRLASDDNGKFSTTINQKGKYIITASSLGKKDLIKEIEISDASKTIDLGQLVISASSEELEGVTIVAQKPLVKAEIDKLVYNMEDDPEAQTSTALDMLRKVPLVSVDADDKIQVKGSGSYKILVNGKPSSMFTNEPEKVLKAMPANSIKNVEVISPPGAKYDSEGVSALINIITGNNSTDGYTGSVSAGLDSRGGYNGSLYLALKYGKFGATVNGSYYRWKSPKSDYYNITKDFINEKSLTQDGTNEYSNNGAWGSVLLSYEIDSLRLLSLSYNMHSGRGKNTSGLGTYSSFFDLSDPEFRYNRYATNKYYYGGSDISLDYQRSFKKPGELLTFSYKLGLTPNDSKGNSEVDVISGTPPTDDVKPNRTENNADGQEHTGQIDYVNPLNSNHTIEVGAKFIHRDNSSEGFYSAQQPDGTWRDSIEFHDQNQLSHIQNILSGYLSYQFKKDKFSVKPGIRAENTHQNLHFGTTEKTSTNYFNLIPSVIFSYKLGDTRTFTAGYNMQVRRPGIWYLNPYEDRTDPNNIQKGNPDLDSEKSHSFNLGFNSFTTKFDINAGLNYNLTNNSITEITSTITENNVVRTFTTYENIGKNRTLGANIYAKWKPSTKLNLSSFVNVNYINIKNSNTNEKNDGFETYANLNGSYTFPKDIKLNFYGGMFQFGVGLQSAKTTTGYYHGLSISKEFALLKNNVLAVSIQVRNPFQKRQAFEFEKETPTFWQFTRNERIRQSFGINFSFRFGELKSQVRKASRTISNDDVSGGGQGGQGQGGGQ